MRRPRLAPALALGLGCAMAGLSAAPAAAQVTFTPVGAIPAPVDSVRAQGSYVYVAAGKTLTVYNVADPAAPKREGAYTFPQEIWAFRVSGSHVYVGVNFFGLGVLDVSAPSAPVLRSHFKTRGQAKIAAVSGERAIVVDHMEGLVVVDLKDPARPVSPGSFFVDGYARDVATEGHLAFGVDSPTGFYILDLSKPDPLEPIASVQSGSALRAVEVSGTLAVLVGGGSLQPYDVSRPAAPVMLPPFRTPGGAQRVALKGSTAYVADLREGLLVVDFSLPAKPAIVGAFKTAGPARDVAVAGGLAFVVVGEPNARPQDGGQLLILRQHP